MACRRTILAGLLLAASIGPAAAQPISGLYLAGGAGANLREPRATRTDIGPVGVLSLGWGYGNGLRAEIEGSYRSNDVSALALKTTSGSLVDLTSPSGRIGTAAIMAKVLYDFDLKSWGLPVSPYIGAGAGYGWEQYDNDSGTGQLALRLPGNNSYNGPARFSTSSIAGQFAYQAIGGLALPLGFVPGLSLTAEYRYFAMDKVHYKSTVTIANGNSVNGQTTVAGSSGTADNHNHAVLIGLRYAFNTAPEAVAPPVAAPVAVPAPAPSRSYLVFFDWDRFDLSDRARQIIKDAADASTRVSTTAIKVHGYTDATGTAAYNKILSSRRAQVVAAELVRDGVPNNIISIWGFGAANPLVPTAPGVREPQNRRVEIILD